MSDENVAVAAGLGLSGRPPANDCRRIVRRFAMTLLVSTVLFASYFASAPVANVLADMYAPTIRPAVSVIYAPASYVVTNEVPGTHLYRRYVAECLMLFRPPIGGGSADD